MTPFSDGEHAILTKLAEVGQTQAVTTERLVAVLDRLESHLERGEQERKADVERVTAHIDAKLKKLPEAHTAILGDPRFWIALALLLVGGVLGPEAKAALWSLFTR
jgi:hypothetical protein